MIPEVKEMDAKSIHKPSVVMNRQAAITEIEMDDINLMYKKLEAWKLFEIESINNIFTPSRTGKYS